MVGGVHNVDGDRKSGQRHESVRAVVNATGQSATGRDCRTSPRIGLRFRRADKAHSAEGDHSIAISLAKRQSQ